MPPKDPLKKLMPRLKEMKKEIKAMRLSDKQFNNLMAKVNELKNKIQSIKHVAQQNLVINSRVEGKMNTFMSELPVTPSTTGLQLVNGKFGTDMGGELIIYLEPSFIYGSQMTDVKINGVTDSFLTNFYKDGEKTMISVNIPDTNIDSLSFTSDGSSFTYDAVISLYDFKTGTDMGGRNYISFITGVLNPAMVVNTEPQPDIIVTVNGKPYKDPLEIKINAPDNSQSVVYIYDMFFIDTETIETLSFRAGSAYKFNYNKP